MGKYITEWTSPTYNQVGNRWQVSITYTNVQYGLSSTDVYLADDPTTLPSPKIDNPATNVLSGVLGANFANNTINTISGFLIEKLPLSTGLIKSVYGNKINKGIVATAAVVTTIGDSWKYSAISTSAAGALGFDNADGSVYQTTHGHVQVTEAGTYHHDVVMLKKWREPPFKYTANKKIMEIANDHLSVTRAA